MQLSSLRTAVRDVADRLMIGHPAPPLPNYELGLAERLTRFSGAVRELSPGTDLTRELDSVPLLRDGIDFELRGMARHVDEGPTAAAMRSAIAGVRELAPGDVLALRAAHLPIAELADSLAAHLRAGLPTG